MIDLYFGISTSLIFKKDLSFFCFGGFGFIFIYSKF